MNKKELITELSEFMDKKPCNYMIVEQTGDDEFRVDTFGFVSAVNEKSDLKGKKMYFTKKFPLDDTVSIEKNVKYILETELNRIESGLSLSEYYKGLQWL